MKRDTFHPGGVHEHHEWAWQGKHTRILRGPIEAVRKVLDQIYADYPSAGYGTASTLVASGTREVVIRVTHWHSCD